MNSTLTVVKLVMYLLAIKTGLINITSLPVCVAIYLPLFSSLIVFLNISRLGINGSFIVTSVNMLMAFFIGFTAFLNQLKEPHLVQTIGLGTWIKVDSIVVSWGFTIDSLTITMVCVVTIISFVVHVFAYGYMYSDPRASQFFGYLSLFTALMLVLCAANDVTVMFVGWEGVGISSYLLINFWNTRFQANKAAIKAILYNKVGDMCMLLAIALMFTCFQTTSLPVVAAMLKVMTFSKFDVFFWSFNIIDVIAMLLFVGVVSKSAQLGLHQWLPDAMEGPTPVSALLHAATMVTAGVFLLVRCNQIFEMSTSVMLFISFWGSLTALFAATAALFQNDIKRIIAYSTCSQLGYMISVCGISAYSAAMFHLFNHAFFKALLFLGAGAIIHSLGDEQDIRRMGGLAQIFPVQYIAISIGSLSLIGFPFLSGYYSKENIMLLKLTSTTGTIEAISAILLVITAILTAIYSMKMVWVVFLREYGGYRANLIHLHKVAFSILIPITFLSFCSIVSGSMTADIFIGPGSDFFDVPINIDHIRAGVRDAEFYPTYFRLIPLFLVLFSALGTYVYYEGFLLKSKFMKNKVVYEFYVFFSNKWHFDIIVQAYIITPVLTFARNYLLKHIEKGFLEFFGSQGFTKFFVKFKSIFNVIQSSNIQRYTYLIIFGVVGFLTINIAAVFGLVYDEEMYKFLNVMLVCMTKSLYEQFYEKKK